MWTGKIPVKKFESSASWKVEGFSEVHSTIDLNRSSFPVVKIAQLMSEKREFLDPQKFPSERFYYLGLENIQSLTGDVIGVCYKDGKEIKSKSKVFSQGDILYGRLRPYLNKVHLCTLPIQMGICSGEFLVFVPRADMILPNVLKVLLTSTLVQKVTHAMQTGSTLPRIHARDLLNISVPLPPMEIQADLEELILQQVSYRQKLSEELQELPRKLLRMVESCLEIS